VAMLSQHHHFHQRTRKHVFLLAQKHTSPSMMCVWHSLLSHQSHGLPQPLYPNFYYEYIEKPTIDTQQHEIQPTNVCGTHKENSRWSSGRIFTEIPLDRMFVARYRRASNINSSKDENTSYQQC
jgi:hypothetical protein